MQILQVTTNMRAQNDNQFADYLLKFDNGIKPFIEVHYICPPHDIVVTNENEDVAMLILFVLILSKMLHLLSI